jgi:hypothetical protein
MGAAAVMALELCAYSFDCFLANDTALDAAGFKWYKLWRNKYVGWEAERGNLRDKIAVLEDDNHDLWSANDDLKGQVKYLEADRDYWKLCVKGNKK